LHSKKTKENENIGHDSMEIDERLKEIKMSQLNESKFPAENLILNPLKDKGNQNIFNEINIFLDKNEAEIKHTSYKNLNERPNFSSKELKSANYLLNDLDNTSSNIKNTNNNLNNTSQRNILLQNKDASAVDPGANLKHNNKNNDNNNSMLENNNLNNLNSSSGFLYSNNKNLNFLNPNLNSGEIISSSIRHNKNSLSMIENNMINTNTNDLSVNLDLYSKKNFNYNNNNPQSLLDNSIYIIKDGKLCNNNNGLNLLNKSIVSVNDEMNKSLFEKNPNANNLLGLNNNLKNNFYQSVGNKAENDFNREKLILDKINLEIQRSKVKLDQESAKLGNGNRDLKIEEEIYLKSQLKKLNNKIDILNKEQEQQEKLVKEAEAKLILKFELELKERLKNDRNLNFNTLTNNQINNSMFNHLNFHSTSNNNTNNNMQISNLNLSVHSTTPGKIDKYNKLINIHSSAEAENFTLTNSKHSHKIINEKGIKASNNNFDINTIHNNNNSKEEKKKKI